ncbi:MAG: penicillin-binding transpeptidase domain-containing protein [Clostridium sp.]
MAYQLFAHVRVRVAAWQDPWSNMNQGGYQICQSLFAIGTGGLFGMGLGQGMPKSVPVVESDFIFSAIAEEMGVIFCIFLILIYISSFIMFVNIALKMKKNFYKLCAFGLSVVLIFQVFLSIGGVTKFIPSTGVTLPLISYGGSSIITTIVIFSIIQGMYVRNRREEVTTNEEQAAINRKSGKGSKRQNRNGGCDPSCDGNLFILAGYMVYFIIHDSDQVLNNSANKRQELLAKRVTKGKILSDKGNVLAKTVTDSSGNETRKYPYGSLFAHVVGRSSHGKTGLEASESYTMLTSGLNPFLSTINELKGKKNPGNNVVTTLNVELSKAASNALGSKRGAVVVMDPETGKILAMVSKPSYDPNQLTDARWNKLTSDSGEQSALYNRATQGLYPPGSTFKLYTAFEFMREQDNYSKFHYTCTGKIGTGSEQIKCYGGEVHGKVDLEKAFAESCNAAFCSIGDGLNRNSWRKLCESFYYNKSIPLEKMEQKSSRFTIDNKTAQGDVRQASIGQGQTLVTPLQNILLVCASVNGGELMQPYVVDRIEDANGNTVSENTPKSLGKKMSEKEAKQLKKLMRGTVKGGTATSLYYGTPYKAGGKTGSAEFQNGSTDSHAWFVGYAEKNGKKLCVSVVVEAAGTGSAYAVPIAKKVFDAYW